MIGAAGLTGKTAAPRLTPVLAAAYDLLARAYLDGAPALRDDACPAPGALVTALGEREPALAGMLAGLLPHGDAECAEARQALVTCFGLPLPGLYVPAVASVYADGGQTWGPSAQRVLGLYEAEGLAWDRSRPGPGGAPLGGPDHIGIEFAFLAVASARPATSRRAARITAMLTHLHDWLPGLIGALAEQPGAGYAQRLTTFAHAVVLADLHRRDEQAVTRAEGGGPARTAPP